MLSNTCKCNRRQFIFFLYLHFLALKKDEDQDLPSIAKNFIEVKVPDRNGQGKRTVLIFLSGKGNTLIKA